MPSWTKEQELAITLEGQNIIVSAGAGSGKTAVLTERVIRKLLKGVSIDRLLVLTFTNEAAGEMKDRIRNAIKDKEELKKELDLLEQAYITTFDSYALSIVKKYHYLLGLNKNINIIDSSIIDILKKNLLDEIFLDKYKKKDEGFLKLVGDFCVKDDKNIKKAILNINKKLDLIYDKDTFLDSYITNFYNENKLNSFIDEYVSMLKRKVMDINILLEEIKLKEDGSVYEEFYNVLRPLFTSDDYNSIKKYSNISLPRLKRGSSIKDEKKDLGKIIDSLKELTSYEDVTSIKDTYNSTISYVKAIIAIIKELDSKILAFKKEKNSYEFNDISKMAIKVVSENESISKELKNFYQEIMVDEYQDTSDLQELFISSIANNNVYMVGDVKQSIYRFRNANPDIFKNKYENYKDNNGGIKIDLLKNFRSREEVLEDINLLFNKVMTSFIGGADYKVSHQMVFGNKVYENEAKVATAHMEIYNYKGEDDYKDSLKEIFIIVDDIKKKINEGYVVYDKEEKVLRKVRYSDFCIILDRGKEFTRYKKVFEYLGIPLALYIDEKLTVEYDVMVLKNLIMLILKMSKSYSFKDKDFMYYFTSVARSFLINYDDTYIYDLLHNKDLLKESDLYKKCNLIANDINRLNPIALLDRIVNDFNYHEELIKSFDITSASVRLEYLYNIASSLVDLGYTNDMFVEYLDFMINDSDSDIKYKVNSKGTNSVKIMNIHKSKGLEFPICYFAGLYEKFNTSDIKERFLFDNHYGIITPYFKEGIGDLFLKSLYKEKYYIDEISEKIRLFYVAVTRSKEKMIFVAKLDENDYEKVNMVSDYNKRKFHNFLDILLSIKPDILDYVKDIDLDKIYMTKDYSKVKDINYKDFIKSTNEVIDYKDFNIEVNNIAKEKFSKEVNTLITKDIKNKMLSGIEYHELFEKEDFLTTDNKYVVRFLKHFKDYKNASIYKEYEFIYQDNNEDMHGIIDLMFVYDNYVDIVDYKLKNTSDEAYIKQLNGYRNYISSITKKEVNLYLYSIMDDELTKIEVQ